MPINIADVYTTPTVDGSGDTVITPPSGGDLNLQDNTGATQLTVTPATTNISNTLQEQGIDVATVNDVPSNTDELTEGTTNLYLDAAQEAKLANTPDNTNSELAGKADVSGQTFTGAVEATVIGTISGNAQQAIAIGNGGGLTGYTGIAWRVGSTETARTGNYRAQIRYDYDNSQMQFRFGNNSNVNAIQSSLNIDLDGADFPKALTVQGNPVFHEGNRNLATHINVFLSTSGTDNPLTTFNTARLILFKGKTTALIGVGALTAEMPSISDFGTSNGDYDPGETFTLLNGNNGGTITLNLPASYNFMINGLDNVNSGNVVITGPGQLTFIAVDGTSFTPNLGNKTWLVIDPAI